MEINNETLQFIEQHRTEDVRRLALLMSKHPEVDAAFALDQIAGRQIAQTKLPTYAAQPQLYYPHHLSMEQCSSELTARYKAEVVKQHSDCCHRFADLTAGYGVDFVFLAQAFETSCYVEQQAYLCELAQHNFPLLGLPQGEIIHGNGIEYLEEAAHFDWLYLDPARRDKNGGKVVAIADCEPNIAALEEKLLAKADYVLVKLSPMLDITLALRTLKSVRAVHVVAVQNECKELLLVLSNQPLTQPMALHCINFTAQGGRQTFSFTKQEEEQTECVFCTELQQYLYEPHAALIKAGGFRSLAVRYGLGKLHPNSHLYTSNKLIEAFPGRVFEIESFGGFSKNELRNLLKDTSKANLTLRNFPASVADLRKRLKVTDGGNVYLFATTLNNEHKVLVRCHKAINL